MPVLDWTKRLKIALGSAKGLAYLHEDCTYLFFCILITSAVMVLKIRTP